MSRRAATLGSIAFFFVGPLLELGVGPFVLTGGWDRGDDLPGQAACTAVGALAIFAGLAVVAWCFVVLVVDGHGTPTPAAPTSRHVTTGPYRFLAHPMYAATTVAIAGQGLVLARPILFVAAVAYAATMTALVVKVEAPRLRARVGTDGR